MSDFNHVLEDLRDEWFALALSYNATGQPPVPPIPPVDVAATPEIQIQRLRKKLVILKEAVRNHPHESSDSSQKRKRFDEPDEQNPQVLSTAKQEVKRPATKQFVRKKVAEARARVKFVRDWMVNHLRNCKRKLEVWALIEEFGRANPDFQGHRSLFANGKLKLADLLERAATVSCGATDSQDSDSQETESSVSPCIGVEGKTQFVRNWMVAHLKKHGRMKSDELLDAFGRAHPGVRGSRSMFTKKNGGLRVRELIKEASLGLRCRQSFSAANQSDDSSSGEAEEDGAASSEDGPWGSRAKCEGGYAKVAAQQSDGTPTRLHPSPEKAQDAAGGAADGGPRLPPWTVSALKTSTCEMLARARDATAAAAPKAVADQDAVSTAASENAAGAGRAEKGSGEGRRIPAAAAVAAAAVAAALAGASADGGVCTGIARPASASASAVASAVASEPAQALQESGEHLRAWTSLPGLFQVGDAARADAAAASATLAAGPAAPSLSAPAAPSAAFPSAAASSASAALAASHAASTSPKGQLPSTAPTIPACAPSPAAKASAAAAANASTPVLATAPPARETARAQVLLAAGTPSPFLKQNAPVAAAERGRAASASGDGGGAVRTKAQSACESSVTEKAPAPPLECAVGVAESAASQAARSLAAAAVSVIAGAARVAESGMQPEHWCPPRQTTLAHAAASASPLPAAGTASSPSPFPASVIRPACPTPPSLAASATPPVSFALAAAWPGQDAAAPSRDKAVAASPLLQVTAVVRPAGHSSQPLQPPGPSAQPAAFSSAASAALVPPHSVIAGAEKQRALTTLAVPVSSSPAAVSPAAAAAACAVNTAVKVGGAAVAGELSAHDSVMGHVQGDPMVPGKLLVKSVAGITAIATCRAVDPSAIAANACYAAVFAEAQAGETLGPLSCDTPWACRIPAYSPANLKGTGNSDVDPKAAVLMGGKSSMSTSAKRSSVSACIGGQPVGRMEEAPARGAAAACVPCTVTKLKQKNTLVPAWWGSAEVSASVILMSTLDITPSKELQPEQELNALMLRDLSSAAQGAAICNATNTATTEVVAVATDQVAAVSSSVKAAVGHSDWPGGATRSVSICCAKEVLSGEPCQHSEQAQQQESLQDLSITSVIGASQVGQVVANEEADHATWPVKAVANFRVSSLSTAALHKCPSSLTENEAAGPLPVAESTPVSAAPRAGKATTVGLPAAADAMQLPCAFKTSHSLKNTNSSLQKRLVSSNNEPVQPEKFDTFMRCSALSRTLSTKKIKEAVYQGDKGDRFLQFFAEDSDHDQRNSEALDENSPDRTEAVKRCKCSRSRCLKQYCECFRADQFCTVACLCVNCMNDGKSETERSAAVQHIRRMSNTGFHSTAVPSVRACRCKRSRCHKKVNPSISVLCPKSCFKF